MSAYRKEDRKDILENIKGKNSLNAHNIKDLIEIIEDLERRIIKLEEFKEECEYYG